MDLKVNVNEESIRREAQSLAEKLANDSAKEIVRLYFRPDNQILRHAKGVGYQLIEEKINQMLTSDDLDKKIQKIIDEKFAAILEEATVEAMTHKAKKMAHEKLKDVPEGTKA